MLVLTGTLVVLTIELISEGNKTTQLIESLENTNELILASLYSDYEMELEYTIRPFHTPEKIGGFNYDMVIKNYGDFDSIVTTKWYLNPQFCDDNGLLKYKESRLDLISEGIKKTNHIGRQETQSYNLNIPSIYENYTNHMPFIFEIWVKAMPASPDKKPIEYFTKETIARIQYDYDVDRELWIPKSGWEKLNCNSIPDEDSYSLILDTMDRDQFNKRR